MERPSQVPSPAGFVVKKGLNSFSLTSGGMPVPLSRILILTLSPRFLVVTASLGSYSPAFASAPRNLLREQIDLTSGRVKGFLEGDVEALFLGPRSVIGEV